MVGAPALPKDEFKARISFHGSRREHRTREPRPAEAHLQLARAVTGDLHRDEKARAEVTADLEKAVRKVLNARKTIGEHDGKRLPEAEELFDKIVDEVKRVSLEELPFVMTDEKRAEIAAKRKAARERHAAKLAREAPEELVAMAQVVRLSC